MRNWNPSEFPAANGKPWNFYVVMGDDWPLDVTAKMPALQARITEYVRFPHSSGEVPVCFPGRTAALCGKRSLWTGVFNNNDGQTYEANAINHTFLVNLQRRGYRTAFVGKGYNQLGKTGENGWGVLPFKHPGVDFQSLQWGAIGYFGYDENFSWSGANPTGLTLITHGSVDTNAVGTDYALDVERLRIMTFLGSVPVGQPWVVFHSTKGVHQGDDGEPVPPARHAATAVTLTENTSFGLSTAVSGVPSWIEDEQVDPWDATAIAAARLTHTLALRVTRALDENIEAITDEIEARGETANTCIIILCDNGIGSGEQRIVQKGVCHACAQHLQLHIKLPGVTGGVCNVPISNLDIAPLIYALSGARSRVALDGQSPLPAMLDFTKVWRDAAVSRSYGGSSPFVALRFGGAAPRVHYLMDAADELTATQTGGWTDADEAFNNVLPGDAEKLLTLMPDVLV